MKLLLKTITCAIPANLKKERAIKKFQLGRLGSISLRRQYIEISSSINGIPIKTAHSINFNKNATLDISEWHNVAQKIQYGMQCKPSHH